MIFQKHNRINRIWKASLGFHGKTCAGLALGVRVCDTALSQLRLEFPEPGQLVCVSESDGCCVDAIQTGLRCTIGKRHLLFYKTGRLIFTVYDLVGGGSVRIITRQEIADQLPRMETSRILSMPESRLFQFEEARPMTPKVWNRVSEACDAPSEQVPVREPGVQDCPDMFRKFDQPK